MLGHHAAVGGGGTRLTMSVGEAFAYSTLTSKNRSSAKAPVSRSSYSRSP
jgi:hypothetical protein